MEPLQNIDRRGEIDPSINLAIEGSSGNDMGEPELRATNLATEALILDGDRLAEIGEVNGAIAKYRQACKIDPSINLAIEGSSGNDMGEPESRATNLATEALILDGDRLAQAGDAEGAIAKYRKALAIDPSRHDELGKLETRAGSFPRFTNIYDLILSGSYQEAALQLKEVFAANPSLKEAVDTDYLNELCWFGSLNGHAVDVKETCELVGELAPENGAYLDSRGVNRGILGDYQGAIEDLEYAIEWFSENGYQHLVEEREDWVLKLKAGQNPFDNATLESLKN